MSRWNDYAANILQDYRSHKDAGKLNRHLKDLEIAMRFENHKPDTKMLISGMNVDEFSAHAEHFNGHINIELCTQGK
jgi:hypothetical protein